jgi:hypothetical protein
MTLLFYLSWPMGAVAIERLKARSRALMATRVMSSRRIQTER